MRSRSWQRTGLIVGVLIFSATVLPAAEQQNTGDAEIAAAKAAAARDPQNWRVFNNLGLIYYKQGSYDQAVSAFKQALALYSVTSILENEKQQQDAQDAQRAALEAKRAADVQRMKDQQSKQEMNELFGMISGIAGMQGNTQAQMLLSTMQSVNNQLDSTPTGVPELSPAVKLESSLKSKREVANIYICLGSAYFGKKDYQQAVASFDNALQLDPSRTEVLKTSAEAQYFLGKYDECIQTFATYHAIAPVEPASLLRLFDAYRALGMRAEADKAFVAFLAKGDCSSPDSVKLMRIGATCLSHWRYEEALNFLTRARQAAGSSPDASRAFSAAQMQMFRTPAAIQLLLAEAQFNLRKTPEAISLLTDAVIQDSANPKAWYMLAQCYDEAGEPAKALEAYSKALDVYNAGPADPSADYIQVCRAAKGDGESAVSTLQTQLDSIPLTPAGGTIQWYTLGLAFEKSGHIPEAMEILSRCCNTTPDYMRARLALDRLGRQTAAEQQRMLAASGTLANSDRAAAIVKLAEAYRLTPAGAGKENLRKTLLKTAAAMGEPPSMTGDAQDHYLRGSVALKTAKTPVDLGRALSEFQWAVFYSPWVSDLYFNTSAVKKLQNRTADAVSDLKLYLAGKPAADNVNEILNRLYEFDYQHEQKLRELASTTAF